MESDLRLFGIHVDDFPQGIQATFKKLEDMLPTRKGRKFYGIYTNNVSSEKYFAAVLEQYKNEGDKYNCSSIILPKGEYLALTIKNWSQKLDQIESIFDELFNDPRTDSNSESIEYYKSMTDLVCIVRLKKPSK